MSASEPIPHLDKVIHERARMGIMSLLAGGGELSFGELKQDLGLTDGNLSVHIKTLQKAGYLAVIKTYKKRRPHTTCTLTDDGRAAFERYIDQLEAIVRRVRGSEAGSPVQRQRGLAD